MTALFSILPFACLSLLVYVVSAVPPVTVIPYQGDPCGIFPNGQFEVLATLADNTTVDRYMTGFMYTPAGTTTPESGTIILYAVNGGYVLPFQCTNSVVQALVPSAGNGPAAMQALTVSPDTKQLQWLNNNGGLPLLGYLHYLDQLPQDGIFIGAQNSTTWAFKLVDIVTPPYYQMRLMLPDSPVLEDGEFEAFLSTTINL